MIRASIVAIVLGTLLFISFKKPAVKQAPVKTQKVAEHMTVKPSDWKTYNLGESVQDGVSIFVPPAGDYCNGCVDGRTEGDGSLTTLSGGYDTPTAEAGWRLFVYAAPIGDTTRPQEFEKLKDTKTVQAGKFQYMFGFESYDSKYINDFDTIGESIMMGHREDGEKL